MTNQQLLKAFLYNDKPEGRSANGTLRFAGHVLSSYFCPIAKLVERRVVELVKPERGSVTTSRHVGDLRRMALRLGFEVVEAPKALPAP